MNKVIFRFLSLFLYSSFIDFLLCFWLFLAYVQVLWFFAPLSFGFLNWSSRCHLSLLRVAKGIEERGGGGLPGAVSRMDVGKIHASRVI